MTKIIAHFMHEKEREIARQKMKQIDETESYLLGEIEEGEIKGLEDQGVIVQRLEEQEEPETPGRVPRPIPGLEPRLVRAARPAVAAGPTLDHAKRNFYLLRVKGPLLEKWRQELKERGVQLLEYIPRNNYTAMLTPEQVNVVGNLPFVSSVRLYGPEDTGPIVKTRARVEKRALAIAPATEQKILTFDIRLHRGEDLGQVQKWLESCGVNIAGAMGRKIRVYLLEESPLADEIAKLPEVASIEEYVKPKLHNDFSRVLLGIDRPAVPNPGSNISQTGDGEIVGIADTGLDDKHPDFQGRIIGIIPLGRPNDSSDPHGHGTHVAGSVLGDGTASGGTLRGIAPKAKLFFQSLLDYEGGLGGLPLDLGYLFEEAYQAGARIHNNSWGSTTGSEYTVNSIEVDEFVAKRRDMLIIISAGNEGQAANCLYSQLGYVDLFSIDSPATSKNALTVGASRSNRSTGGYSQLTYGQAWPGDFPNPPIGNENVSGNCDAMAAFSSRGLCLDRRIKPDVVAPGTDIVSTKSFRAPLRNFWGSYPGSAQYAYMGGTSMAAPFVSGCAALVREYYVKDCNHQPSAALLKATLINSTKWLAGIDAVANHPDLPNHHQGFGCIYMPWAIPNLSEPNLKLEFVDTWKDPSRQFVRSGQRIGFQISISGGNWLRICLSWTDPPARALQNNLNLFVQDLQTGTKSWGNEKAPAGLRCPDPDNNVEVVRLQNPNAGNYLIQITATNILQGPQDFALVVTGDLASSLVQI